MPQGVHRNKQTAFRIPPDLLDWLRGQAEREGDTVTMTGIVVRALERERALCADQPGTDRSWDSVAEIASRVTRHDGEGKQ